LIETQKPSFENNNIKTAKGYLNQINLEFNEQDSIIFFKKAIQVTYPEISLENNSDNELEDIAKTYFHKSGSLRIFLCNLRQILHNPIFEKQNKNIIWEDILQYSKDKTEFTTCLQEVIKRKMPLLKELDESQQRILFIILLLRMFGINLNDSYIENLDIYTDTSDQAELFDKELLFKEEPGLIHQDEATEFLFSLYDLEKTKNRFEIFDKKYHIKDKLSEIINVLEINDIYNIFITCVGISQYTDEKNNKRNNYPLELIINNLVVPEHLDSITKSGIYLRSGIFYLYSNDHNRAIIEFDNAIKINPNDPKAYNNKGSALSEIARQEEAIQEFDKAIERDPNYAVAYYNKGLALGKLGRQEEAIQEFDKAIEREL
jgi:tetratricopeptide (TPR) repeat protein